MREISFKGQLILVSRVTIEVDQGKIKEDRRTGPLRDDLHRAIEYRPFLYTVFPEKRRTRIPGVSLNKQKFPSFDLTVAFSDRLVRMKDKPDFILLVIRAGISIPQFSRSNGNDGRLPRVFPILARTTDDSVRRRPFSGPT